jgi:hypothetical protein
MGAIEKIYSIILLFFHGGILIASLVAAGAPWFVECETF